MTTGSEVDIRRVPTAEVGSVIDVMCEAFADYPVMRFVIGSEAEDYPRRLQRLVGFFVMARALRNEPLLAAVRADEALAAATVSFPGGDSPPELAGLREEVWRALGADARERYEACGEAWAPLGVEVPHVHLNMIGVRPRFRGRGLARRLLEAVQDLSRATSGSQGVTLTTESQGNVTFYERAGYEVVGYVRVAPGLESWGMFRRNRPAT